MQSEVIVGLLSVAATIGGALIQRSWRLSRPRLPKHESIEFGVVHESASFAVQDSVKILDLGNPGDSLPGRASYTDSYLVRREHDDGNGMVFRYATSGTLQGECVSHAHHHVISAYDSSHFKGAKAISVMLNELADGSTTRITNSIVFTGAFDKAEGDDFETHIERPTRSLTMLILFSPQKPCRSAIAQIQLGERGAATTVHKDGPVLSADGSALYWRIVPNSGQWLPIGAKYRLEWTWQDTNPAHSGAHSEKASE